MKNRTKAIKNNMLKRLLMDLTFFVVDIAIVITWIYWFYLERS